MPLSPLKWLEFTKSCPCSMLCRHRREAARSANRKEHHHSLLDLDATAQMQAHEVLYSGRHTCSACDVVCRAKYWKSWYTITRSACLFWARPYSIVPWAESPNKWWGLLSWPYWSSFSWSSSSIWELNHYRLLSPSKSSHYGSDCVWSNLSGKPLLPAQTDIWNSAQKTWMPFWFFFEALVANLVLFSWFGIWMCVWPSGKWTSLTFTVNAYIFDFRNRWPTFLCIWPWRILTRIIQLPTSCESKYNIFQALVLSWSWNRSSDSSCISSCPAQLIVLSILGFWESSSWYHMTYSIHFSWNSAVYNFILSFSMRALYSE